MSGKESGILQLVTFRVDNEEFGVAILKVQEIIRVVEVTKVPNSPPFVEGVINLRGRIIPIIDMRKRMGLPTRGHDSRTRIIVLDLDGVILGFVVDSVSEVLRIPTSTVEEPPAMVGGVDSEFISGVGKLEDRLLILLDLEQLLTRREKAALAA